MSLELDRQIDEYLSSLETSTVNGFRLQSIVEDSAAVHETRRREHSKVVRNIIANLVEANQSQVENGELAKLASLHSSGQKVFSFFELKEALIQINSFLEKKGQVFLFEPASVDYHGLDHLFWSLVSPLGWVPDYILDLFNRNQASSTQKFDPEVARWFLESLTLESFFNLFIKLIENTLDLYSKFDLKGKCLNALMEGKSIEELKRSIRDFPTLCTLTRGRSQEARFAISLLYLVERTKGQHFLEGVLCSNQKEQEKSKESPKPQPGKSLLSFSTSIIKKSLQTVKKSTNLINFENLEKLNLNLFETKNLKKVSEEIDRVVDQIFSKYFDQYFERLVESVEKRVMTIDDPKVLGKLIFSSNI